MSTIWLGRATLSACLLSLLFPACKGESIVEQRLGDLSTGCLVNSDCAAPLVCAFERCHAECVTTRDCDGKLRCIGAQEIARVCQLESEVTCKTTADCAQGLVCGSDGSCRDTCELDEQCIGEQVCTQGVCAEPEELDESGELPQTLPQQTCRLSSDCALGSRCEAGVCLPECLTSRDCASGSSCEEGACIAPVVETCESAKDCTTAGQLCVDGSCRCECQEDVDCAAGSSCDGCACVAPPAPECESAEDCDPGQLCANGACACECVENRDCAAGSSCDGCACEPLPGRTVIDDATLYDASDLQLMQGIVEVKGLLQLRGPYLKTTIGLEALQTVGDVDIYGMNAVQGGLDGGDLMAGFANLTLIRGNLTITNATGFTSFTINPKLEVLGNVKVDQSPLTCEQLGEVEQTLRNNGFTGQFTGLYNGGCPGFCQAGMCYPPS